MKSDKVKKKKRKKSLNIKKMPNILKKLQIKNKITKLKKKTLTFKNH